MAEQKIVLVTGANRGLGFAIIKLAGSQDPSAHFILACRNFGAGEQAVNDLKESGVTASLELLQLDITKDADILKAVESVTTRYGRLDVLVNNAGIAKFPTAPSLAALRACYTETLDVNVTSVACICAAFQPLLAKSAYPKVINFTSGLGSLTNILNLTKKMARLPPYGTSKVAVNGLTVHLQTAENDRVTLAQEQGTFADSPKINYYSVAPGFLKTALTHFSERGSEPSVGAEVVVQLMFDNQYLGGTQWECVDGKMQEVPW